MSDKQRTIFVTWLAVYPTITVVLLLVEPYLGGAPLALRTLIVTVLMVPLTVYVALPLTSALLHKAM
ncbi:MAG: hypothetical protein AAGI11_08420 [Pseudomonadota bacterium]